MKTTGTCPKCQAQYVIHIPGRLTGSGAEVINLSFVFAITVARYVCGECGYVEHWVDSKDDVDALKPIYKRLSALDAHDDPN